MSELAVSENYAPLLEAYERKRLIDLIPLEQPLSMMVDPSSACNFKCRFCPTGNPGLIQKTSRKPVLLDLALYQKIIDDIDRFTSPLAVLRLYKDGEPLLNPNIVEFVRIAKKSPNIERVETTTNGAKLTKAMNDQLIGAGLDRIVISVEGVSREKYLEFAGVHLNLNRFIDTLAHLYQNRGTCQVHIKTVKENLGPGEDQRFKSMFGGIADRIFIENTVPSWPNFNVPGLDEQRLSKVDAFDHPIVHKRVCPYLFYSLSVNADGIVSPCCVDWDRRLALGDVATASLPDIWNGKAINRLRFEHLTKGRQGNVSCKSCGQIDYCSTENLDNHVELILCKMGFDREAM